MTQKTKRLWSFGCTQTEQVYQPLSLHVANLHVINKVYNAFLPFEGWGLSVTLVMSRGQFTHVQVIKQNKLHYLLIERCSTANSTIQWRLWSQLVLIISDWLWIWCYCWCSCWCSSERAPLSSLWQQYQLLRHSDDYANCLFYRKEACNYNFCTS